jgi:hypothetical protein
MDCLSQVPPVELAAMRLIRTLPLNAAGGWFPTVPPDSVAEAARELIAYTKACAALTDQLKYLSPVPLTTLEIPEWPQ